jgi:polar amino acid transport system substrate-binding protein
LLIVIDGLSVFEKPLASETKQEIGPAQISQLLEKLKLLLEDDDTDATDVIDELLEIKSSILDSNALKKVAAAVDEYDFDEALQHLANIEIDYEN